MKRIPVYCLILIAVLGAQTASLAQEQNAESFVGAQIAMNPLDPSMPPSGVITYEDSNTDTNEASVTESLEGFVEGSSSSTDVDMHALPGSLGIDIFGRVDARSTSNTSGAALSQVRANAHFSDFIIPNSVSRPNGYPIIVNAHMRLTGDLPYNFKVNGPSAISLVALGIVVHGRGIANAPLQMPESLPRDNYVGVQVDDTTNPDADMFQAPPESFPVVLDGFVGDDIELDYDLKFNTLIRVASTAPDSGSAFAEYEIKYNNTFAWDGIDSVVDANTGEPLPRDDWSVTSASGLDYSHPAPEVPEPATVVPMMFAAAGWCLRRGRAA